MINFRPVLRPVSATRLCGRQFSICTWGLILSAVLVAGSRLHGELPVLSKTLPVNLQDDDTAKLIEYWGLLEEPAAESKIESDKKTLTITAPDMYVDNYPPGKVNAPRVFRDVSGDFTAEVDVTQLEEAEADTVHKSLGNFSTAYHSGTLLFRHDDETFVRFERVSMNRSGRATYTCELQIWKDRQRQFYRSFPIENKPVRLRLERRAGKLTASFSQDEGDSWTKVPEQPLEGFPQKATVGVSLTSNTEKGCKVTFEGFKLKSKDD